MTILNREGSDGSSEVLFAICEFLIDNPKVTKSEVEQIFSQGSKENDKTVLNTINRWIQFKLFEETDSLGFSKELLNVFPKPCAKDIPRLIRHIILSPKNNPLDKFWFKHSEEERGNFSVDFSRACAWILAQDQEGFKFDTFKDVAQISISQLEDQNQYTVRNNTRYPPLIGYMKLLGFIETGLGFGNRLVADPTRAVTEELEGVFDEKQEMSSNEFVEKLGEKVPVLDGGFLRKEVEKNLSSSWTRPKAQTLSKSLTRALYKISKKGILSFQNKDDDTSRWVFNGLGNQTFTSVIRNLDG